MTLKTAFLRIDDRLIHGQVIVGWLPSVKPKQLIVVNDKVFTDLMRQDLMSLSVPADIDLKFFSTEELDPSKIVENSFILVSSPLDAWKCLQKGLKPDNFNVGGMHSRDNKEEIFEALHLDKEDRKYFDLILEMGYSPIFQPTPQNAPISLCEIF